MEKKDHKIAESKPGYQPLAGLCSVVSCLMNPGTLGIINLAFCRFENFTHLLGMRMMMMILHLLNLGEKSTFKFSKQRHIKIQIWVSSTKNKFHKRDILIPEKYEGGNFIIMDYFIQENRIVALVSFCQEVKLGHGLGLEFPVQMTCSNLVQTNFRPKIFDSVSICAPGCEIMYKGPQLVFKINTVHRQYGLFHILGKKECYKTVAESDVRFANLRVIILNSSCPLLFSFEKQNLVPLIHSTLHLNEKEKRMCSLWRE